MGTTTIHIFRQWLSVKILMLAFRLMPMAYKVAFLGPLEEFEQNLMELTKDFP